MSINGQQVTRKQLGIFIATAFGVTYLMMIPMYLGLRQGTDLSCFANTQMMYPACGVILAQLLTGNKDRRIPMGFYLTLLITTGIMIVISIASVVAPLPAVEVSGTKIHIYVYAINLIMMAASVVGWITLAVAGRQKRAAAGLTGKKWKSAAGIIVLFLALYMLRITGYIFIDGLLNGTGTKGLMEWVKIFRLPVTWLSIVALPLNYLLVFLPFFGEEYGWRYFLQPIMHSRFGGRAGVILLGIAWGLWHLPLDLMYYTTTTGIQMVFSHQIVCIALAIFIGYAYLKTNNIWVPVIIHYLNNNLVPIVSNTYSADVMQNQSISWNDLAISLLVYLPFILFIISKVFVQKQIPDEAEQSAV